MHFQIDFWGDQLVVDPNYGKNQKDGNYAQNNKVMVVELIGKNLLM